MRKSLLLASVLILAAIAYAVLGGRTAEKEIDIPEPPNIEAPEPVILPEQLIPHVRETMDISEPISGHRFEGCTLTIIGREEITLSGCLLLDSKIIIEDSREIEVSDSIITGYYVDESASIQIRDVTGLLIHHNEIVNNSVGVSIGGCGDVEISCNLFEANDQHNAVTGLNCEGARIHGNVFRFNFPHALMIMNREADPRVQLEIYENTFDRNVEDAVNFENFTSELTTRVHGNRINGTGWAGINVEYNSWGSNIVIEDNYIDCNGLLTEERLDGEGRLWDTYPSHGHQPEPYSPGWGHGVKLEDCSGVTVRGNVIVSNAESGVDIRNARDITLEENTITLNRIGVSIMCFHESSLTREFSPLSPEDAGASTVEDMGNTVLGNLVENWYVEEGCRLER